MQSISNCEKVCNQKLIKHNDYIFNFILEKVGLEKGVGYCDIHKKNYECLVDKKTNKPSGCPFCEEEAERKIQQQALMYSRIDGLPKRYRHASFKNYVVKTETQRHVFNTVLAYAENPSYRWLVMLGNNGTGKTHLSHALLKCTGGIYREFDEIASELLDAQAKGQGEIGEIIHKYSTAKMLVIDEIDKVKATEGRIRWLNIILRRRYNNLLPLVILGNTDVNTICNSVDLLGNQAIRDRIREVGTVLQFTWTSYRENQ